VNIQALESRLRDGRRVISKPRSVATDDRGQYRLWNLSAGNYFVKAAGRSGATRLYIGDRGPSFDSHQSFKPVYYGGAQSLSSASPVSLKPSEHAQADFTLSLQPATKIQGTLTNFTPYQTVQFELLSGTAEDSANRVALNSSTGRFEMQDVAPGNYRLRATQGSADQRTRAEVDVQVPPSGVKDVALIGIAKQCAL
jgi:hypothetical protein